MVRDFFLFLLEGISKNHCTNELFVKLSLSKPYETSASLTFNLRQAQADRVFRDAPYHKKKRRPRNPRFVKKKRL